MSLTRRPSARQWRLYIYLQTKQDSVIASRMVDFEIYGRSNVHYGQSGFNQSGLNLAFMQ